jgi:hypothetical protein
VPLPIVQRRPDLFCCGHVSVLRSSFFSYGLLRDKLTDDLLVANFGGGHLSLHLRVNAYGFPVVAEPGENARAEIGSRPRFPLPPHFLLKRFLPTGRRRLLARRHEDNFQPEIV